MPKICEAGHSMAGYGRLRPACCAPRLDFSRVGAWVPSLPTTPSRLNGALNLQSKREVAVPMAGNGELSSITPQPAR